MSKKRVPKSPGEAWKIYVRAYIRSRRMDGLDPRYRRSMRNAFMAGWRAMIRAMVTS